MKKYSSITIKFGWALLAATLLGSSHPVMAQSTGRGSANAQTFTAWQQANASELFFALETQNAAGKRKTSTGGMSSASPFSASTSLLEMEATQHRAELSNPFKYEWRVRELQELEARQNCDRSCSLQFDAHYSAQHRPFSPFPEKASPTMFPGSRLRGPFDQIYPRPFPGGGQP